jgi:hypothetical protein
LEPLLPTTGHPYFIKITEKSMIEMMCSPLRHREPGREQRSGAAQAPGIRYTIREFSMV